MLPRSAWAQGRSFRSPVVVKVWSPEQRKDIPAPGSDLMDGGRRGEGG